MLNYCMAALSLSLLLNLYTPPSNQSKRSPVQIRATRTQQALITANQYVQWDSSKSQFSLNGSRFDVVGPNAYWLGFTEAFAYPTHAQVDEVFAIAAAMGSTVIRSHTLGFSSGLPITLRPSSTVLTQAAFEPIDYAIAVAASYGIKLIVPFTDAYNYVNGNYGDYCITRGVPKANFFNDTGVRADFKDYISQYLNHVNQYTQIAYKNDPTLFLLELGNELGNIRPDKTSVVIPTQEWILDISAFVKSIDTNHLVLNPSDESLGQSLEFKIPSIDVFSAHFYTKDLARLDAGIAQSVNVSKPYIIGESSSNLGADWFALVEARKGVHGSLFWHLYPHVNGLKGGGVVQHTDGYTLYYPEDATKLLGLSNHFRRMRGMPEIASLIVPGAAMPYTAPSILYLIAIPITFVLLVVLLCVYNRRVKDWRRRAFVSKKNREIEMVRIDTGKSKGITKALSEKSRTGSVKSATTTNTMKVILDRSYSVE